MSEYENKDESYRNHLATSDISGKRKWVFAKKPSGKYHIARAIVAVFLLSFLFLAPFVEFDGHPMLMFNVLDRIFIIFGVVFWPQDFFIFAIAFLVLILFIVSFTSIFGRLWCGWACPQTIFMEMLFRKIEYVIEGDSNKQMLLERAPLTVGKITKKVLKHGIFFFISFLIANTFLAYIIGKEELFRIITDPVEMHLSGLTSLTIFSLVFYSVFARFREQACVVVCPYGRFQSVLVDEKSIAVTYDFVRGEPRGKLVHELADNDSGDCIDCKACVRVCPTGIDIRNGIQLECVNCTACMDACDEVMTKINKPTGLIRYASYENIVKGTRFVLNFRSIAYISVLTILMTILFAIFMTRTDFDITLLRQPGITFQKIDNQHYSNMYSMKISNKSFEEMEGKLEVLNIPAEIKYWDSDSKIKSQQLREFKVFIVLDKQHLQPNKNDLQLVFTNNKGETKKIKTEFIAPAKL